MSKPLDAATILALKTYVLLKSNEGLLLKILSSMPDADTYEQIESQAPRKNTIKSLWDWLKSFIRTSLISAFSLIVIQKNSYYFL